jgi:hypothetical protein
VQNLSALSLLPASHLSLGLSTPMDEASWRRSWITRRSSVDTTRSDVDSLSSVREHNLVVPSSSSSSSSPLRPNLVVSAEGVRREGNWEEKVLRETLVQREGLNGAWMRAGAAWRFDVDEGVGTAARFPIPELFEPWAALPYRNRPCHGSPCGTAIVPTI